jgi:hypothetical protein
MPILRDDQCYQVVAEVDIEPVLAVWDRLPFFTANVSGSSDNPNSYMCDVVVRTEFPPELQSLMTKLGLGGTVGRAVLRRLAPRQSIPVHTDTWMPKEVNWRRFQVPLISHPDIIMRWPDDGQQVYLEPGFAYEVRYDRPHEVVHGADVPRTHLQIDQVNATI